MLNSTKIVTYSFIALLLGASQNALAQGKLYSGVNSTALDLKNSSDGSEASFSAVFGNVGYQVNSNVAVEGRVGLSISDDNSYELGNYFGLFTRFSPPVNDIFFPYLMAGFGTTKISQASGDSRESSVAYGVGVNFAIGINIEYMNYYDKDDREIIALSFGFHF